MAFLGRGTGVPFFVTRLGPQWAELLHVEQSSGHSISNKVFPVLHTQATLLPEEHRAPPVLYGVIDNSVGMGSMLIFMVFWCELCRTQDVNALPPSLVDSLIAATR